MKRSSAPTLEFEKKLWEAGVELIAGLDEAGRGSWAGPVAAAAVILPHNNTNLPDALNGVRDSKQMTPLQRDYWANKIKETALAFSVGFASNTIIDEFGILPATRIAMEQAIEKLPILPQHLLIDALPLREQPYSQTILIKGDQRSLSISAASILAKTARDALMAEMEIQYPGYGFAQHKGYGTALHRQTLTQLKPCLIHRFSYKPVSRIANGSPLHRE